MREHQIQIFLGEWETAKPEIHKVRFEVFIQEQGIDASAEWDEFDSISHHIIARLDKSAIGTARIVPQNREIAKIGRVAVLKKFRNRGFGRQIMQFALQKAKEFNFRNVHLHAQVTAVPFYRALGFIETGSQFYEENILHQKMLKSI